MAVRHPHLVFLYGPPAVGKLTVARELERRLGYRVLHNHVTVDPVLEVLEFGSPGFNRIVERLRFDLLAAAAEEGVDLIYTIVIGPEDIDHVEYAVRKFEDVGGEVTFVQLLAPREELLRRVSSESRAAHKKLVDAETLAYLLDRFDLYAPVAGRESLTIDLGETSAADAADQIVALRNFRT
jgi:hypothetical protein